MGEDAACMKQTLISKPCPLAAEKILETYCMWHEGEFIAVHEMVSRVKKE